MAGQRHRMVLLGAVVATALATFAGTAALEHRPVPTVRAPPAPIATPESTSTTSYGQSVRASGKLSIDDEARDFDHLDNGPIEAGATYVLNGAVQRDQMPAIAVPSPGFACNGGELSADGTTAIYERVVPLNLTLPVGADDPGSIRVVDLRTGADRLVAGGACAPTVASDGRIAFRRTADGALLLETAGRAARWGPPGMSLTPLAWAHDQLIVERNGGGPFDEDRTLLVFESATRWRRLDPVAPVSQVDEGLVALSPDGTAAMTSFAMRSPSGGTDNVVRVVRVADGATLARGSLGVDGWDPADGEWVGDVVIASTRYALAGAGAVHKEPRLLRIRVQGERLEVEQHVLGDGDGILAPQLQAPRGAGELVSGWLRYDATPRPSRAFVTCSLAANNCWFQDHQLDAAVRVERRSRP